MNLRPAVWAALATVLDPELDEPITELDFVETCTVSPDGVASVVLRLPTFFCAPNFSWLMVADAYDAVSAVPGVTRADVKLADHHAAAEINGGVAAQAGFVEAFSGQAVAELDELRKAAKQVSDFSLEKEVKKTIDPDGSLEKSFQETTKIDDPFAEPQPVMEPPAEEKAAEATTAAEVPADVAAAPVPAKDETKS